MPSTKSIDRYLEEYRIRFSNWLSNSDNSKIENFFESSLLSHEQEVRKEVLEEIEKKLPGELIMAIFKGSVFNLEFKDGYNKCLSDVKEIINSMK